jgi:hypothetical protein
MRDDPEQSERFLKAAGEARASETEEGARKGLHERCRAEAEGLGSGSIEPPYNGCCHESASEEVSGELVIAGGDAAEGFCLNRDAWCSSRRKLVEGEAANGESIKNRSTHSSAAEPNDAG